MRSNIDEHLYLTSMHDLYARPIRPQNKIGTFRYLIRLFIVLEENKYFNEGHTVLNQPLLCKQSSGE